jgi:hypothetical protein
VAMLHVRRLNSVDHWLFDEGARHARTGGTSPDRTLIRNASRPDDMERKSTGHTVQL